jgi:hypothetical protein
LSSSLSRARGQCRRIKKGIAEKRLSPEKDTKKGRVSLYRTLCLEKRLDFPYIKVSFFVVLVNPARLSIDSPQPAGTIKHQRTRLAR